VPTRQDRENKRELLPIRIVGIARAPLPFWAGDLSRTMNYFLVSPPQERSEKGMAKHCTLCNQEYGDDLAACPHCAAAKKTHLASRVEDRTTQLADSNFTAENEPASPADSAIDFGAPTASVPQASGEPLSGTSAVAWSALVEEPGNEPIKIDSPSDADLLAHGVAESTPPAPHEELVGELPSHEAIAPSEPVSADEEMVDLSEPPPQNEKLVSDSEVDLGGPPVELLGDDSGAVLTDKPKDESDVFVAELASDAQSVDMVSDSGMHILEGAAIEPLHEAAAAAVDASIDKGAAEAELNEEAALDAVEIADDSSLVNLGSSSAEGGEELAVEEVGEVAEVADGSGINLEGLPTTNAPHSDRRSASESMVDLGSHAEIPTTSHGDNGHEVMAGSGIDVGNREEPAAIDPVSDLALESLLTEPAHHEAGHEESVVAAHDRPVSAEDSNDFLAGLNETPPVDEASGIGAGAEALDEIESGESVENAAAEETVEAEEEEKPKKPVKPRSRVPALVGGTFLGILLGAGGLIGARVGGVDVPAMMGVGESAKAPVKPSAPTVPPVTFDALKTMVQNGDFEGATKAGIDTAPASKPDELAARGDYRLGAYLQKAGNKINPQDPALQPALQDLQKAAEMKDPLAIYDLAFIKELAGQLKEAGDEYAKGVQAFQNDPALKQQFESAVQRVELKASRKAGEARLSLPERLEDRAALAVLLLMGLQQPGQPPQPDQAPPVPAKEASQEAGFDFWQAAKLARAGKFADAIRVLDRARALHDQRRFSRLRKAQNPLSDPAEDIFLRCCEELKVYWRLEDRLRDGGYLTEKNTPPEALQALLQTAQSSAAILKDVNDKLVNAKLVAPGDDLSKGVARLIDEKMKAEAAVVELTAKFQKASDENTKLSADLTTAKKTIADRDADLASAKDENAKLKTANGDLNATLKKVVDELANAKFFDPKGKENVGEAVKKAVDVAKIKDPQGMLRQLREEIALLTSSLKERWKPEEMLPLWLLLLDENRGRTDLTNQAAKDVDRVTADAHTSQTRKGEAAVVLGLALRNTEKFSEAKKVLEAARGSVDKGEWLVRADAALKEVSNPAAYFANQAQTLYDRGRLEAALAVLDRAMKVLTAQDQSKLLAQRSLIELDAARTKTKGTLSPTEPLLIAARKDAAEAAKAGLAEGHYASGRIAEEMGQLDAAIQSYRAALAAHQAVDAEGARYRMALARVLLLPREARPGQPVEGQKIGWRDPAPYPARHFQEMKSLVLMLTLGLQAPLLPGDEPGFEEAEKLADEVLAAEKANPGSVRFDALAQALAVKGRWNAALQTYVEGIRPMLPREYGNGLMYMILNHPRLKRPDSLRIPNPLAAGRHFAAGLNFYFDRDYANAERAFLQSIELDSGDARYFYFLGLSRLQQNHRRDAYDDFDAGAALERVNRPSPAAVSEALERIQGPNRRIVNEFRQRQEDPRPRQER
jgi:hypothetical protein